MNMHHHLTLSLLAALTLLAPSAALAESAETVEAAEAVESTGAEERDDGFGVAVNTAVNGQVLPLRLIAAGTYRLGVNQFELGVGFHPFFRREQTVISTDFNYKLFPNGRSNKFNTYLLANLSYIYTSRVTFFPTTYNYLFLHGGYGIELASNIGTYMDTNVSFGGFTSRKNTENPAASHLDAERFFRSFGSSINFQVNVGYRF